MPCDPQDSGHGCSSVKWPKQANRNHFMVVGMSLRDLQTKFTNADEKLFTPYLHLLTWEGETLLGILSQYGRSRKIHPLNQYNAQKLNASVVI